MIKKVKLNGQIQELGARYDDESTEIKSNYIKNNNVKKVDVTTITFIDDGDEEIKSLDVVCTAEEE